MAQRNHSSERTKTGEEEKRNIPTDLLEEILLRFPANDLLKFKLVCKDWLRLISSPRFIQNHLDRSKASRNVTRILMRSPSSIIDYNYFADGSNISKEIPFPPGFSGETTIILGSCDGLICLLHTRKHKFAVFNPSTRKSDIRIVDGSEFNCINFYWFGHHPSTGEYILIIGSSPGLIGYPCPGELNTIAVYKFSRKLKSELSCSFPASVVLQQQLGVLLHGTLHWPADVNNNVQRTMVFAYDLEKNKILEMSAPRQYPFTLGVVDGCICAILTRPRAGFELWIMKEYGVEESWTKYVNIEGYDICWSMLYPLGFSSNGDLIIHVDAFIESKLTKYSFGDKQATTLLKYCDSGMVFYSTPVVCVDSLVSPVLI